eukprot:g8163.t1
MVTVVSAAENLVFRCESEDDLDGASCRVDMLPDAALAEMVYERGFDVEGADRLQLLDAVMQLLDYEYATGENLREMEYIPDDGSAAAAAESAAADLEMAAANAAAAALAAENEAAALAAAAGGRGGVDTGAAAEESGECGDAATDFEEGGGDDEPHTAPPGYDVGDDIAREVIEESSSSTSSSRAAGVGAGGARGDVTEFDESTLLGYAQSLATEVLRTMRRDMNYLVGMLPAPVAKPIRDTATFVGDTASRFVAPALRQAERHTRGLRRGAGRAAWKGVLALKDDVLPRVAKGAKSAASEAKRRLGDALEARRKGDGEEEGEERQKQHQRAQ